MKAPGKETACKRALKATLCLVCSIILTISFNPAFAIASNDDNPNDGIAVESTLATSGESFVETPALSNEYSDLDDGRKVYSIEEIDLAGSQSSKTMSLFSTRSSTVGLKKTNEVKWFDRIDFPAEYEETFKNFYDLLIESCDNDGVLDFLIEDKYIDPASNTHNVSEKFKRAVNKQTNEGEYTALQAGVFSFSDDDDCKNKIKVFNECLRATIAAFDRDHPEVFWLGTSANILTDRPESLDEEHMNADGQFTARSYLIIGGFNKLGILSAENIRSTAFSSGAEIKESIITREKQIQKVLAKAGRNYTGKGAKLDPLETIEDVQYTDS